MIAVENLRKQFNSLVAVDGVSFEVAPGEVFGLLGPNGAGKTTTINMIVGLLKPDRGTINVAGYDDPTRSEVRMQIGNAPQTVALYENLTAQENLAFFGKVYGLSGQRLKERVEWALDFARLTDRRKDRVQTYSGGMKRRLNMAGAVVHDPPVILFDEPTVGVDPQSRNMIFENIEGLKQQGRTIIYTTHYMEEAERLCDRVAIMDRGHVLDLDTVDNLIEKHGGKAIIEAVLDQPPEDMSEVPGTLDDNHLRIETMHPNEDLARLAGLRLSFRQLRVDRPDLETVFLNLTGRSLRD
jgi:ABC-2 type transport system ATP-binding protein